MLVVGHRACKVKTWMLSFANARHKKYWSVASCRKPLENARLILMPRQQASNLYSAEIRNESGHM